MIISDGKEQAKNTRKQPDLVGLSENHPKKHKKCIYSKIAKEKELKLKISIFRCINVISSSGRIALSPAFAPLEQQGE